MTHLIAALDLSRKGYYVHPLCWPTSDGSCGCGRNHDEKEVGKAPLATHGSNSATRDEALIRDWWQRWPNANVSISLDITGLVDIAPDCTEWAERFKANSLPHTTRYDSGGGADHWHTLYRLPKDGPVTRINVSKQYDIMSQGNAVAPGSLHPSGRTYTAQTEILPVEDLPLAPAWAIELLQAHVKAAGKEHAPEEWHSLPSGATLAQSRRFQALCKANAQLRAVCAGEAVTLTTKSGGKDSSTSIQRSVFVNQLLRAKYPNNEIRALSLHFSGVLESNPKWFGADIDRLLRRYTPADYAPESTGVVVQLAPRGGRHYEITAAELLDRYHEYADCGPAGIVLDWTVAEAAERLGVSTGTIKRREAELTEAGQIRREYGRVILSPETWEIRSQRIETRETDVAPEPTSAELDVLTLLGNHGYTVKALPRMTILDRLCPAPMELNGLKLRGEDAPARFMSSVGLAEWMVKNLPEWKGKRNGSHFEQAVKAIVEALASVAPEPTIGSQPDLPQPDAPNVPESAVCIKDHVHEEITHPPGEAYYDPRYDWTAGGRADLSQWHDPREMRVPRQSPRDSGEQHLLGDVGDVGTFAPVAVVRGRGVWEMKRRSTKRRAGQRTVQAEIRAVDRAEIALDQRIERLADRVNSELAVGHKPVKRAARLAGLADRREVSQADRTPAPTPYRAKMKMPEADLPDLPAAAAPLGAKERVLSRAEGPPVDGPALDSRGIGDRLRALNAQRQAVTP